MSHEVEQMAYVGEVPWHGLGNQVDASLPIAQWQVAAGLNWQVHKAPVLYDTQPLGAPLGTSTVKSFKDQFVLYRSDTGDALSVMSARYKPVQPQEVLEFFRDLVDLGHFTIETAGSLKGGRKIWALARTRDDFCLPGNDLVKGYLLLATSYNGELSTVAQFTSVRVVCNNTLTAAVGDQSAAIRIPHFRDFDAEAVKAQLGIGHAAMAALEAAARLMTRVRMNDARAFDFIGKVFDLSQQEGLPNTPYDVAQANSILARFTHNQYQGASLPSSDHTLWGLLNTVTEYVDHDKRARGNDGRMDSAWFGKGAQIKQRALDAAVELVR